jgi:4-amino-4-deoxy-L-arabinose transferase-like glycosyltransferase
MNVEVLARDLAAAPHRTAGSETASQPGLPTILALLAAFVAIWTIYFSVTEAPGAIKHDMAEAYAWGHEFQLGYNQHPPFWAWICGLWFSVFPRSGWAFALLSSLNAGIGLWGAWEVIGDFAQGRKRLAAWWLLLLTPLYTFYAYKYNANIIFLSIWPWTLHCFMRSLRSRTTGSAVGLGVCFGLALMSKYYAVILVASCFLALLQHPARWRYLGSVSPVITAAVTSVICAPHLWWLVTHKAPPLRYLEGISGQGWKGVADYALNTLAGSVEMNLGVVAVVLLVAWITRRTPAATFVRDLHSPKLRVLATLALAPLVLTVISAVALRTRQTPEMTIATFALLPLLVIELARVRDIERLCRIAGRLAVAVTLGALVLSPAIALQRTFLSPAAMKTAPLQEAAAAVTKLWHERTSRKLAYVAGVAGTAWYDNAIVFYSSDRPHTFVDFDYGRNLWATPEKIARYGLVSVCVKGDPLCLARTAEFVTPETTRTEISLAHKFWGHVARPIDFVVTIIPPRP